MQVPLVEREHRAAIEGEKRRVEFAHVDVDLGELCPGNKLARSAVDGLLGKLESPVVATFGPQEIALDVEKGVGLGVLLDGG